VRMMRMSFLWSTSETKVLNTTQALYANLMRNGRTDAIYRIFSLHLTGQQQQQRSTFSTLFENH
jgi:hypothetical protein